MYEYYKRLLWSRVNVYETNFIQGNHSSTVVSFSLRIYAKLDRIFPKVTTKITCSAFFFTFRLHYIYPGKKRYNIFKQQIRITWAYIDTYSLRNVGKIRKMMPYQAKYCRPLLTHSVTGTLLKLTILFCNRVFVVSRGVTSAYWLTLKRYDVAPGWPFSSLSETHRNYRIVVDCCGKLVDIIIVVMASGVN